MRDRRQLKLLMVAEHASAIFGGEALIPYQYFRCLRELNFDVHLLVHDRTKRELLAAFPNDVERLHFVPDSWLNVFCYKVGQLLPDRLAVLTLGAISHFDTQFRQRRLARTLIRQHQFDLVHEPIPVSPKLPSMMFGLSVPVIIGPMNGGMDYPPHYDLHGRFESMIIWLLRYTSLFWNIFLPGKRRAALLLVANRRTRKALPTILAKKRIFEIVENGVDLDRFNSKQHSPEPEKKATITFIGRLVDFKRLDLLLEACSRIAVEASFCLHVVGDGPLRKVLEQQAQQLCLLDRVQFHGMLPQARAAELLRESDIMVLPSMRECGGAVVLEAMASEVPVIAAKWGGPADYIDESTGILIPPQTPEAFVADLASAILRMIKNPDARVSMGKAARKRARLLFDWRVKAQALLKIYEDVVNGKSVALETARS